MQAQEIVDFDELFKDNESSFEQLEEMATSADENGNNELIKKMKEKGIDQNGIKAYIDSPNNGGSTPLSKALFFKKDQFAAMLISYGAEFEGYFELTGRDSHPIIKPKKESEKTLMKYSDENVKSIDNEILVNHQSEAALSTLIYAFTNSMYKTLRAMVKRKVKVSPEDIQLFESIYKDSPDEIIYFKNQCKKAYLRKDYDFVRLFYALNMCPQFSTNGDLLPMHSFHAKEYDLFIGLVDDMTKPKEFKIYDCLKMISEAIESNNAKLLDAVIRFGVDLLDAGITFVVNLYLKRAKFEGILGALPYSIASGKYLAIIVLFEKFYNSELTGIDGVTNLHRWAIQGRGNYISEMMKNKNPKDEYGNTPLHYALIFGNEVAANHLILLGAEYNVANNRGEHPIHIACMQGFTSIVSLLIEKNVDINAVVKPLVKISLRFEGERSDETPLHFAAKYGHLDIVRLLLKKKVIVDQELRFYNTPLNAAAEGGHSDIVLALLDAGAEKDSKDSNSETALHLAAKNGLIKVIEALISKNANLEIRNISGESPLCVAAKNGRINAVKILAANGANVNAECGARKTPLYIATENDDSEMIETLLIYNANVNQVAGSVYIPLNAAIWKNNFPIFIKLLLNNADYKIQDYFKQTALHKAASQDRIVFVKEILRRAIKTDGWKDFVTMTDKDNNSALKIATSRNSLDIAQLITQVMADDFSELY